MTQGPTSGRGWRRRVVLSLLLLCGALTAHAQTRQVTALWIWDQETHVPETTWELEADGGPIVPCALVAAGGVTGEGRCQATVPASTQGYRLRGTTPSPDGPLTGPWSSIAIPPGPHAVTGLTPLDPGSEPEPMAVGVSSLAAAITTSNPAVTGSLTWTAGSRGYAAVAVSRSSGDDPGAGNVSISGWTIIGTQVYSTRRRIYLLRSDSTPSNGTLSISYGGVDYQETIYGVIEATGIDGTTPNDASQVATGAGTSLTLADVGTIDAGDLVLTAAAHEGASNGLALTDHTSLVSLQTGTNVRALVVGWQTTDDTPTSTNNGGGNGTGMVGLVLNAAAGGGGAVIPAAMMYYARLRR
jgi:hypothetical protein